MCYNQIILGTEVVTMNITQPFKVGDKVMAPSISFIIKQNSNENKFVPATIIFAHPTNGWCSYRYDRVNLVGSYFSDMIFTYEGYQKHLIDESLRAAEMLKSDDEDDDDYDDFKESVSEEPDDEPDDFDESLIDDDDEDDDLDDDDSDDNGGDPDAEHHESV